MTVNIKKSNALNRLNMTPIIDVVFQLLIFFLVASKFEEDAERELDLQLPQASEAMARIAKPKEIFVSVDREGRILLGGNIVSPKELEQALRQAQVDNPGRQTVIVRGDERSSLKHTVAVMNVCAKAGIRDCRIGTAAVEPPQSRN
jgi:biopolymer transport protein ExbD